MPITNYRSQKTQYRQAETMIAKFVVSGGGATLTRVSGSNQVSNNKVGSPVAVAGGIFTLTLPKVRLATLFSAIYFSGVTTPASQITLLPVADVSAAGTQQFAALTNLGVAATMANGATLSFVWQIAQ